MDDKSPAHEALLQYQQADQDGIMVLVSRQAIHEVSDEIERLRDALQTMKGAFDTPIARRSIHSDFANEARAMARVALS